MKNVYILFFLLSIFILSSCTVNQSGNQNILKLSDSEIQSKIKIGVTTKQEIIAWLGEPEMIGGTPSVFECFTYHVYKIKSTAMGEIMPIFAMQMDNAATTESKIISINFEKNIVTSYSVN